MKETTKSSIVNGLKTAVIVAGASITLNSCVRNSTNVSKDQESSVIAKRTDSIVNTNPDYRLSKSMADYTSQFADSYRLKNKKIAQKSAVKYIRKNITDIDLRRYMLGMLIGKDSLTVDCGEIEFMDTVDNLCGNDSCESVDNDMMSIIRNDYRWFNDLMLYLDDKYTPEQLLKSGFFKTINDFKAEKEFKTGMKNIEKYENVKNIATKHASQIYSRTQQECANEYKKEKQR